MKKDKIVLTSALIYANGPAHIGHMLEYIEADVISRALKLLGHDVLFCGAEDTHGAPIEIKAMQLGITPEKLIADMAIIHKKSFSDYFIKYDSYYNTNSSENKELAELIFHKLKDKNLIYKKTMELTYCEHDKRFLPDRYVKGTCPKCGAEDQYGDQCEKCGITYKTVDLVKPYCTICRNSPIRKNSDHYFFKLSEFSEKLRDYLNNNKELQPEIRNQILSWIDKGLDDWCVSRDAPYFGFKIPGEEDKYFYVWLDAPIGYISTLSHGLGSVKDGLEYWNDSKIIHIIGKDIIYFHLLFWPAVLMGAELKLPHNILVHGFLNVNNEKMSKSRGTFLNADELSVLVKPEYFRYYIASNLTRTMSDINFDLEDFKERINNELVGNIANFVYRVLSFVNKNFESSITKENDDSILNEITRLSKESLGHFERYDLRLALQTISKISALGNKYFQENEPWKLIKTDENKARQIINTASNIIKQLTLVLKPVLPEFSCEIEKQLNVKSLELKDLDIKLENHNIGTAKIIFEKIEKIILSKEKSNNEQNNTDMQKNIFNDAVQLRVAKIIKVEKHPQAEKLYIEHIDFGDEKRIIVSGLVPHYKEEELLGRKIVVVTNLEPANLRGVTSEGMLLAAEENGIVEILSTDADIGEYVHTDEMTADRLINIKNLKKINIKEFAKTKFTVNNHYAYMDDKELKTSKDIVKVFKITNGTVR